MRIAVSAGVRSDYLKTLLFVITLFWFHKMSSSAMVGALSDSVVVIGLNAAYQKRFVLAPATNLVPGDVHRAHHIETGVGGKGQDVGVALSCLASRDVSRKVLLAQFLGAGPTGDAVASALKARGLGDDLTVRTAAPLRTCTTIVGADAATELVETAGVVTADEMVTLFGKVEALAAEGGRADGVCVMGSLPPGCGEQAYADLTSRLAGRWSLVLIDSVVGLDPLLSALATVYAAEDGDDAVRRGGAVLKLNAAELCRLAGVVKSAGEAARVTQEELAAAARGFVARHAAAIGALDYLCVTDGRWPGHLVEVASVLARARPRTWEIPAADLSASGTLYPIGAGDAVAAGTLAAWQYLCHDATATNGGDGEFCGVMPPEIGKRLAARVAEWSGDEGGDGGGRMVTAFAFGLACGAASCLQEENSVFEAEAAAAFFDRTETPVQR